MLTVEQITKGIQTEMRKVAECVDELATAGDTAAQTDVAYEIAKARVSLELLPKAQRS